MTHICFIIGNGFDLDLGFPTSYVDFANPKNKEWNDFVNMTGTIIKDCFQTEFVNHMKNAQIYEKWFDIENEILKFANFHKNLNIHKVGLIRLQYEALVKSIQSYIFRVAILQNKRTGSFAENLLRKLNESKWPVMIYSFNYTDCFKISGIVKNRTIKMNHIHGSLSYNMALGCRPYGEFAINTQLDFLYKSTERKTKELLQNLSSASEVIVFGHSLNEIDFCYFDDFFHSFIKGICQCKNLTIVCKDEKSEDEIKRRLKKNGIDFSLLKRNVNVKFICTDSWYEKDDITLKIYDDICNRLSIC